MLTGSRDSSSVAAVDQQDPRSQKQDMTFEYTYLIQALLNQNPKLNNSEFIQEFKKKLESFKEDIQSAYEFTVSFSNYLKKGKDGTLHELKSFKFLKVASHKQHSFFPKRFYVKAVGINNDSTTVYQLPKLIESNRVFRKFDLMDFIKVQFSENSKVLDMITILDKKFQVVGGSQSQIKKGSIYYYDISKLETGKTANSLMDKLGKFDNDFFKKISRQSLNFTPTVRICTLKKDDIVEEDDTYAGNGSILSDGIGMISYSFAAEHLKNEKENLPTAFQVRIAGFKGMLTVYPDDMLKRKGVKKKVILRKSMKKFECNKDDKYDLEIVASTKEEPSPAYFNTQVFLLLYSRRMNFFSQKKIENYDYDVMKILKSHYGDVLPSIDRASFHSNPFLIDLLRSTLAKKRDNGNMLVTEGMTCYGLLDETKELKEKEVFVMLGNKHTKYAKPNTKFLKSGTKVLVFRYPVLNINEIKMLTAKEPINNLQLSTNDCAVVFSSVCAASDISGDLDGDKYVVIWDESLSLIGDNITKKIELKEKKKEDKEEQTEYEEIIPKTKVTPKTLSEAFTHLIIAQQYVGKIVTTWQNTIMNGRYTYLTESRKLAKQFQIAMDFPKTGILPNIDLLHSPPNSPLKTVRKRIDFMYNFLTPISDNSKVAKIPPDIKPIFDKYIAEMEHWKLVLGIDEVGVITRKSVFEPIQEKFSKQLEGKSVPMSLGSFSLLMKPSGKAKKSKYSSFKTILEGNFREFVEQYLKRIFNNGKEELKYLQNSLKEITNNQILWKYIAQKPNLYLILTYLIDRNNTMMKYEQFATDELVWSFIKYCILKEYLVHEDENQAVTYEKEEPNLEYLLVEFKKDNHFTTEIDKLIGFITDIPKMDIWYPRIKEVCEKVNVEYIPFSELLPLPNEKMLGKGIHGEVFPMMFRSKRVAVKKVEFIYPDTITGFLDELDLLAKLRGHENIAELYAVSLDGYNGFLIMEYCDYGLWNHYFNKQNKQKPKINFDKLQFLSLLNDIANGMEWMHKKNVLHRDLTVHNIVLLEYKGEQGPFLKAKLIDFHLSVSKDWSDAEEKLKFLPLEKLIKCSPEAINDKSNYHFPSDVFMFGNILWEILHREEIYHRLKFKHAIQLILQGKLKPVTVKIDLEVLKVLENCWNLDPDQRPTFESIVKELSSLLEHEKKKRMRYNHFNALK